MKKTIYYVVVVLLLLSCKRTALEESLILAGENRKELEAVLRHYSCDTLKYKAAVFLIEYMQGKYSLVGEALDSFYVRVDSAYEDKDNDFLNYRRFLGRSVKNIDWQGLEKKYDLKCITSEYLIKNIDDAFELRDSRWCRDLSFEDFCLTTETNGIYQYDIDIMKVIYMLAIHELGETIIGDLTQFQITKEEKEELEHKAVHDILDSLIQF